MDLDEAVNEKLKMQFKTLQEQQQKRMQNLMEKKREKLHIQHQKKKKQEGRKEAFGIHDDLGLSTLDCPVTKEDIGKRLLEDENEQLQQQLRETVDENGRLYKLLSERDFEIKQLLKKIEDERLALLGTSGLKGDVAAAKIVELAKRNRHMTAEIESEKTKVKQLSNKVRELEKELQVSTDRLHSLGDKETLRKTTEGPLSPEIKALQEKLAAVNLKVSEYRNQLQTAKQELKMMQKVLVNEVGEDVNIQNLLSSPGSWRGRAQQILILQGKVRELESQLNGKSRMSEGSVEDSISSLTDSRKKSAQEKNQQRIRSLEKEKKEALEKMTGDYNALQKEFEDVKKRLEGTKARNKVLTGEVKTLKEQISTLLDKGKHDDELIDALLCQQKEMQVILKNLSQQDARNQESQHSLGNQMNIELQKQNCLIEQLRKMVAEREARVKELEEKVETLTPQSHLRRAEENSSDSVSTLSAESLEEENGPSAPRKSDHTGSNRAAQFVSKMGHTLIDTGPTSFTNPERLVEPGEVDVKALKIQITEYKALCQAAEVEKDRLIELVSTLQKRVDDSIAKVWEAENKLQEQQRKCLVLEQQFKRVKEDAGKTTGPAKGISKSKAQIHNSASQKWNAGDRKDLSTQLSEVPLESQIEELTTRLAIQMDDNQGLKSALEETMKSKEEDFQVYQETVGQVKKIFLQALRQQKQDTN